MPSISPVGSVLWALSAVVQFGGHNPVRMIASSASAKGTSMGRIFSGGSRMAGAVRRGRFGGGDV